MIHKCYECKYQRKTYSEELKKNVFMCTYISKVTAWNCVDNEVKKNAEKS